MRQRRFSEVLYWVEDQVGNDFCRLEVFRNCGRHNEFDVAFVVAPTKKLARAWCRGGAGKYLHKCLDLRSTGRSGISCLLWAQQQIMDILPHLRKGDVLFVDAADEQRRRVYRRLLKHGFKKWTRTYADGTEATIYGYQRP